MASDIQHFSAMGELAEQISIKARRLEQEAIHKDQVHDGEAKSQNSAPENETLQKTQTSILDDCRALQDLLVGPGEKLRSMGLVVSSLTFPMDIVTDILRRTSTTSLLWSSSITIPSHLMSRSTDKSLFKNSLSYVIYRVIFSLASFTNQ